MNEKPLLYSGEVVEDSINLSEPPASGEEYIKRVILEARNCDNVSYDETTLKKPTLNVKPTSYLEHTRACSKLPECAKAPECLGPSQQWQKCQTLLFSDIRMYIAQLRQEILNNIRKKKYADETLPSLSDKDGWIRKCSSEENDPSLTVILSLSQPTIEQVIEYLVENLENQSFIQPEVGRWLYSLLAALELPLNPDMCSCLRSLARSCSTIRSQLDASKSDDAVPLNLFICLVARYFRQLDLADI